MKKLLLLLLLFPATLLAQRKQGKLFIDSLFQELPKQRTDTDKINLLNELSFAYGFINPKEGIHQGHLAQHLAEKIKWNKGLGFAFFNLGYNYVISSNGDSASVYFNLASEINKILFNNSLKARLYYGYGQIYQLNSQNTQALDFYQKGLNQLSNQLPDKTMEGLFLLGTGTVWNVLSNPLKALEFLHKGVKLAEEVKDYYLIATAYGAIGNVYFYFDSKQAIENYQRALEYYKLIDSKQNIAIILCNIGLVEANLSEYDKALVHDLEALKLYREIGDPALEAQSLGNIGYVYDNMGNYPKALKYYKEALVIDRRKGVKILLMDDLNGLGNIYNKMQDSDLVKIGEAPSNRHKMALSYALEDLEVAREAGMAEKLSDAWKLLYEIYEREQNVPKAYDAYKNYIVFRDSNVNKANNQELTRRDMQFGFDKQQLSDSLKNEETKRIARFKLQKQRTYTYGAFAGVGMLVLLSFFIFKNYNTQKKSNKMLAIEKNKSDNLLLNILPAEVAEELKHKGYAEAKHFDDVTVLFSDFVNFTGAAERMSPQELVTELDNCFTAFDEIVGKYNIEKIKTIGDAYMAVCGLPAGNTMHAQNIMMAALEIRDFMRLRNNEPGTKSFNIRIGIHSGSVVAGIVGTKKFAYDIWGDAVNTAARMEQNSEKGMINISEKSYDLVKDEFNCTYRGELEAKNKGKMKMYFMESKKDIWSA